MRTIHNILLQLADGRFHSGSELAATLGFSRTTVWKQIQHLTQQYNIPVQAVQGRGYRLEEPLELLDAEKILDALTPSVRELVRQLQVLWSLDSTNRFLMEGSQLEPESGTVVAAEHQRAGRGRRGREWISPFGKNLYFSILWHFKASPATLSGLSLAVAVAIMRALASLGITGLGLKWPNDILWQRQKLCGVLLEMQGEAAGPCMVVTGVGLNVKMPVAEGRAITQPWTDLSHISSEPVSRNRLLAELLNQLLPAMQQYEESGLRTFLPDWRRWDAMAGKQVQLLLPQRTISGRAKGIDDQGNLLLEQDDTVEAFAAGEISLKANSGDSHATAD